MYALNIRSSYPGPPSELISSFLQTTHSTFSSWWEWKVFEKLLNRLTVKQIQLHTPPIGWWVSCTSTSGMYLKCFTKQKNKKKNPFLSFNFLVMKKSLHLVYTYVNAKGESTLFGDNANRNTSGFITRLLIIQIANSHFPFSFPFLVYM